MIYKEARGSRIPALGFGTFQLTGDSCRTAVLDALEIGYRHIDTARIYGNEAEVGQALSKSGVKREDLFLTSKAWREDLSAEGIRSSIHKSLELLGTNSIDLYLIHWPNPEFELEETLTALMELKDKGLLRQLGVSNFPPSLLERACEIAPVFADQVEYHPLLAQNRLLEIAKRNDLLITAYSPLARGRVSDNEVLVDIGRKYGKSAGQVALRWLIEQPRVVAIPKSSHKERIQENFEIFDFKLDDDDRSRIDGLPKDVRTINPGFAPNWNE